jgi:glutathione S-transferase
MPLTYHYHPLASFCWKPLIALYENGIAFEPVVVDFGNPESAAAFKAIWPMAKMPVLVDADRDATVAESTIVVDYLDGFHTGRTRFTSAHPDLAWKVRFWDRFFDHYLHVPMQKIVVDNLRPEGQGDAFGVKEAHAGILEAYGFLESELRDGGWMVGEEFTLADCSAAPALFYANVVEPLGPAHPRSRAYLRRLMARPSFARVLAEAEPYFQYVPVANKPTRTPPD